MRPHDSHTPRKILVLHDNARQHIAIAIKDAILELGWEPLPQPTYSPDLAPSDYYLFRSLQHFMSQQSFMNDEVVRKSIDFFLSSKKESFFCKGIHKLKKISKSGSKSSIPTVITLKINYYYPLKFL